MKMEQTVCYETYELAYKIRMLGNYSVESIQLIYSRSVTPNNNPSYLCCSATLWYIDHGQQGLS